jgi:hypothetical protein
MWPTGILLEAIELYLNNWEWAVTPMLGEEGMPGSVEKHLPRRLWLWKGLQLQRA